MELPSPAERQELAEKAGLHPQYLYQCMTGRRDMDPRLAVGLEALSGMAIRRWNLRRDWHLIWPELIGAEGAPQPAEPVDVASNGQ